MAYAVTQEDIALMQLKWNTTLPITVKQEWTVLVISRMAFMFLWQQIGIFLETHRNAIAQGLSEAEKRQQLFIQLHYMGWQDAVNLGHLRIMGI